VDIQKTAIPAMIDCLIFFHQNPAIDFTLLNSFFTI